MLAVRNLGSHTVAFVVGDSHMDVTLRLDVVDGLSTISPGFGFHGSGIVMFLVRSSEAVIPLYKNRCLP